MSESVDIDYYRGRLEDVSLIEQAIPVLGLTAVPVGGKRSAGCLSFGDSDMAAAAALALREKPGFPNVSCEWSESALVCNVVRWGDPLPSMPDFNAGADEWSEWERTVGRLYGYRDEVIEKFIARD